MRKVLLLFVVLPFLLCTGCGNETADAPANKNSTGSTEASQPKTENGNLLFFGNSLTAGYGLDQSQAFPALIQQKIDSAGLPYRVINGGVSGETSAGGNQRIDFVLKQQAVA